MGLIKVSSRSSGVHFQSGINILLMAPTGIVWVTAECGRLCLSSTLRHTSFYGLFTWVTIYVSIHNLRPIRLLIIIGGHSSFESNFDGFVFSFDFLLQRFFIWCDVRWSPLHCMDMESKSWQFQKDFIACRKWIPSYVDHFTKVNVKSLDNLVVTGILERKRTRIWSTIRWSDQIKELTVLKRNACSYCRHFCSIQFESPLSLLLTYYTSPSLYPHSLFQPSAYKWASVCVWFYQKSRHIACILKNKFLRMQDPTFW